MKNQNYASSMPFVLKLQLNLKFNLDFINHTDVCASIRKANLKNIHATTTRKGT